MVNVVFRLYYSWKTLGQGWEHIEGCLLHIALHHFCVSTARHCMLYIYLSFHLLLQAGFHDLNNFPRPFWLALFPEGTRFTQAKLRAAQEYATSAGLPVPKNVLIPRTKVAYLILSATNKSVKHSFWMHIHVWVCIFFSYNTVYMPLISNILFKTKRSLRFKKMSCSYNSQLWTQSRQWAKQETYCACLNTAEYTIKVYLYKFRTEILSVYLFISHFFTFQGFVLAVHQLRSFVPAIYNITVAIPKTEPAPTMLRMLRGHSSVVRQYFSFWILRKSFCVRERVVL